VYRLGDITNFHQNIKWKSIINIEHADEFYKLTDELSVYISGLQIKTKEYDNLINLISKQLEQAEREAFIQGLNLGIECSLDQE
jgi:hypothetical protein